MYVYFKTIYSKTSWSSTFINQYDIPIRTHSFRNDSLLHLHQYAFSQRCVQFYTHRIETNLCTYYHVYEWLYTGFGLVLEFIDHLHTQLVTVSNYNSLTELHTPDITVTTAHIKSSQSHTCMLRALPSNCRCLQSHHLATGLYATVCMCDVFQL
jgi:hypothetical protein